MTPVEDHHLAIARHLGVDPPEVVVCQLSLAGLLERRHSHTGRVDPVEHVANRAVLAAGVHGLQDHEQPFGALRPHDLLQPLEFGVELERAGFGASPVVGVPAGVAFVSIFDRLILSSGLARSASMEKLMGRS
ncbi:MAG: hypothetical protein R2710_16810 [Acidimicrobiales bacterium]